MLVSSSKILNFISFPHHPPLGGRVGGAYKAKTLAARDPHLLLNIFFIKQFGVVVLVVLVVMVVVCGPGGVFLVLVPVVACR